MSQHPDVFIIGGGIIGLTSAIRLREAGFRVALCDRGEFGKEASWAGAGILPPGNPERASTPIDKLRAIGAVQFPMFSQQLRRLTGIENGYRVNGGIEFLSDDDGNVPLVWEWEGIRFQSLESDTIKNHEPHLCFSTDNSYLLPDMAQVRNPWHLRALISACQKVGVELLPHTGVESWLLDSHRVTGVRLASGECRQAAHYLLCAGPWSEPLLEQLHCRPGVVPVRGQILLLRTLDNLLRHTLIVGKRYLVPRGDGRILVGSTEEPEAGFAKHTTDDGLRELREFANELIPSIRTATVESSWAGLRPGSPDGLPFLGQLPGYANVFAAVGHHRAGVQLSLGTAQFLTELISARETCVPTAAFALDRVPDTRVKPAFRS